MTRRSCQPIVFALSLPLILAYGCSSTPEFAGDADARQGGDGDAGGATSGEGNINVGDGDGDGDADELPVVTPCGDVYCTEAQRCESEAGEARCVPNTCADLDCTDAEECVETDLGAICEDLSCDSDLDCRASRFCNSSGVCEDDVCTSGVRSCSATGESGTAGDSVYLCASSGSGFQKEVECGSAASFRSVCVQTDTEKAGCGCEDDWDCPGYQECEAGICQGSTEEPSCRLEPADFSEVLPSQEIVWGSAPAGYTDARLRLVDGIEVDPGLSPWADSMQVTVPPIIANLNDDNGDGRIDERDVPDIVFLTFTSSGAANDGGNKNNDGILRVLHGGGIDAEGNSKKGRDYLAICETTRFLEGQYWDENDDILGSEPSCGNTTNLDPSATPAVGDLNFDGRPEIVAWGEESNNDGFDTDSGYLYIFDNEGRLLLRSPSYDLGGNSAAENPGISLANVVPSADPDQEMVEVIVGRDVFTLEVTDGNFSIAGRYTGTAHNGINAQGPLSCVADLIPDRPGMEIVAGSTIYGIPLSGGSFDAENPNLVTLAQGASDGFCAIADVWGADTAQRPGPANPLDGKAELVVVRNELFVYAVEATDQGNDNWNVTLTELIGPSSIPLDIPGNDGGAPNIDDFDGDGFPEVGTAGASAYLLFDFQVSTGTSSGACQEWEDVGAPQPGKERTPPPGSCSSDRACNVAAGLDGADPNTWLFACNDSARVGDGACVCLHNSWRNATEDDSSRVTGSSVFDFNGDGSAEVIYNDECKFRIYGGLDGTELFSEDSESRTRIEYPVVADVDNDGNAEIIFATTTESGFCSDQDKRPVFNAGIEVWGDLSDRWVSARRVWNQYSYHVTNVLESSAIPRVEPNSWQPLGTRFYNTYRSQPRSFGSAPDLVVANLQVIAPGSCGESSDVVIGAQVKNEGDLRVSNVPVRFYGTWDEAGVTEELTESEGGQAIERIINQSLEPRASVVLQVEYPASANARGTFPDSIEVVVDPASSGDGVARECKEDNNSARSDVAAAPPLPDLRVQLNALAASCPPDVTGTVFNDSSVAAGGVVVRIFAGDPASGGSAIGDLELGSIPANGSATFDDSEAEFERVNVPVGAPVRLFAVVDPDDEVAECNEANNGNGPTNATTCNSVR